MSDKGKVLFLSVMIIVATLWLLSIISGPSWQSKKAESSKSESSIQVIYAVHYSDMYYKVDTIYSERHAQLRSEKGSNWLSAGRRVILETTAPIEIISQTEIIVKNHQDENEKSKVQSTTTGLP